MLTVISAAVRVAVDGGVNHLKEMFNNDMLHPNIISGDFDSALSENIEFFQDMVKKKCFIENYNHEIYMLLFCK